MGKAWLQSRREFRLPRADGKIDGLKSVALGFDPAYGGQLYGGCRLGMTGPVVFFEDACSRRSGLRFGLRRFLLLAEARIGLIAKRFDCLIDAGHESGPGRYEGEILQGYERSHLQARPARLRNGRARSGFGRRRRARRRDLGGCALAGLLAFVLRLESDRQKAADQGQ